MSDESTAFTAYGKHSRTVEVKIRDDVCFECRYKKKVLVFDNSNDEYTPMRFCIECLQDFHNRKVSESSWLNDVSEI